MAESIPAFAPRCVLTLGASNSARSVRFFFASRPAWRGKWSWHTLLGTRFEYGRAVAQGGASHLLRVLF